MRSDLAIDFSPQTSARQLRPHTILKTATPTLPPAKFRRRLIVASAFYVILHLASHLSARWFEVAEGISLWYPPSGLALAYLLLFGLRLTPVVFGAMVLGAAIEPGIAGWWTPWLYPALITVLVALMAHLVRTTHGSFVVPGNSRETAVFSVVTLSVPCILALAGTGLSFLLGFVPVDGLIRATIQWWVGDASGVLTTLPACLVLAAPWFGLERSPVAALRWDLRAAAGFCGRMAILLGVLWAAFAVEPLAQSSGYFLGFLPLVWISVRHGLPGAAAATLVLTMGTLIGLHLTEASTREVLAFLVFELTVAVVGLGIGATVTRRNRAEARLLASEARLDRVLTGAHLGLWDWHLPTGTITYNARCAQILELSVAELENVEPTWERFAHAADRQRVTAEFSAHLEGRSALYEIDFRVRTRTGQWRWIHSRGSIVERDSDGQPVTVSGTHLDITDRFGAEAETRRLMQIIEVTTDFVLTTDLEGRVVHANAALLRFLGLPTLAGLRGRALADILTPDTLATFTQEAIPAARTARSWLGETTLRDPSGRQLPVSVVALLHAGGVDEHGLLSFTMRDLSHQKATEAEKLAQERRLQQLQKNESLCVLAGGVAHDFNNLLTTMLGNANLVRLDLAPGAPQHESLAQIEVAATRAAELCQLMLAYAGRAPLAFSEVDISQLVENTRHLLRASAGTQIVLDCELDRPLPAVRAAPPQIEQVLVSLVQNAAEAIGDRPGRICVRSRAEMLSGAMLATRALTHALVPGEHVVLEVEDNGSGMTAQTRARIFEPFFTTRFTGQGLGLAAVHGIISAHEGAIEVLSELGKGSLFRVFLPAVRAAASSPKLPPAPGPGEHHGHGLALIVDDEPSVRSTAAALMKRLGYETVLAADGVAGVEQFQLTADRLTIVLLDLTMPRMNGEEAIVRMREIRSAVPVVLMSGYSERLTPDRFKTCRPAAFLPKPFDHRALQAAVESALESPVG